MAESVVTFFAEKLSLLIEHEARLLLGVDEQARSLRDELQWIRSFLRDADRKRKKDNRVDVWVGQIRDLAYDAEDVIDAFILKVERQRQRKTLHKFISYPNQLIILHNVGKQIEEINRRSQNISANRSKYGIENLEAGQSSISPSEGLTWKEKMIPIMEEADVVGFTKDADELAARLIEGESRRLVISIVGMGGLGKTTLAKQVYNRNDIKKHFDTCAWIYVSQEYRVKDLLRNIIKQVGINRELEKMNEEELGNELFEHLQEKRYLVVFDDIWNKEAWDCIKAAFPNLMNGSRVMLTTRNRDVALHADPSIDPHYLRLLDEEESWELFSKKVFPIANMSSSFPIELEQLGKKIVERCGGLPLAIVVVGGLLSVKDKTPIMWSKVLDSVKWQLTEDSKQCMKILALSYDDLPYYLKSCFLYFGLFPEDFEINVEKLILLWIAEGFIQPRGEEKMEDVAEDCLEELIQRNMIQVAEKRENGGVLTCCIHDLLRDLAISEGKKDRFLDAYGNNSSASAIRSRRLAIHLCNNEYQYHSDSNLNIRSLFFFPENLENAPKLKSFYGAIKLLRVLDLEGVYMYKLPKEIGELILLKYLGLKSTWLKRLPSCVSNLRKLQTLDIRFTWIKGIPKAIWKMKQLRHVYGVTYVSHHPQFSREKPANPMGELPRDLLTLELRAGSWIEGGLGKLRNLRQLVVVGLEGPYTLHSVALSNAIVKLDCLRSLTLVAHSISFDSISFQPGMISQLPLLQITQHQQLYQLKLNGRLLNLPSNPLYYFPPNLIELHLSHLFLEQELAVMLEKLPNLRILVLEANAYAGQVMVFSAGGFARLQFLKLRWLLKLAEWRVEVRAMPSLEHLDISYCCSLKMLPDGLRHITTLQKIEILGMSSTFKDRVEENGDDWDKIKHVPSITIEKGFDISQLHSSSSYDEW